MRICPKCRSKINDNELICPKCGKMIMKKDISNNVEYTQSYTSGYQTAAKIFLCLTLGIIAILTGILASMNMMLYVYVNIPIFIITLICTIYYFRATEYDWYISIGYKIFILLFINLWAGVFMLLDSN